MSLVISKLIQQPPKKIHALNKAIGKINIKSPTAFLAEVLFEQNFNK